MIFKSVIFDLDGTLIDSIQDIADSCNKMLKNHGFKSHNLESYITWIGNGARLLIERSVPEIKEPAVIDELLAEYREIYDMNCINKTRIYPGMDDFLELLASQNIPVSILTNKPHAETLKIAAYYLKKWNFSFILGQRNDYPKKPDPAVALSIAAELKIKPQEILFIGDSSTDIVTALAAEMIPVGVTWGYGTPKSMKDAGATVLYNKPEELFRLVMN